MVGRDAHAVIDEAKAAGVYVFGGGIDEDVPPVLVSADGSVAEGGYPWAPPLDGGFTVLELPSREEAVAWAARIASAHPATPGSSRFPVDLGVSESAGSTNAQFVTPAEKPSDSCYMPADSIIGLTCGITAPAITRLSSQEAYRGARKATR